MGSPEEIKRLSRRVSGGVHDGEGPELNLWPSTSLYETDGQRFRRGMLSAKVRLPLAAVMLGLGAYDVSAGRGALLFQGVVFLVWAPVMVWEVYRSRSQRSTGRGRRP